MSNICFECIQQKSYVNYVRSLKFLNDFVRGDM